MCGWGYRYDTTIMRTARVVRAGWEGWDVVSDSLYRNCEETE